MACVHLCVRWIVLLDPAELLDDGIIRESLVETVERPWRTLEREEHRQRDTQTDRVASTVELRAAVHEGKQWMNQEGDQGFYGDAYGTFVGEQRRR